MKHALIATILAALGLMLCAPLQAQDAPRTIPDPAELSARRAEFSVRCKRDNSASPDELPARDGIPERTSYPTGRFDRSASLRHRDPKDQSQLDDATATSQGARASVPLPVEITSAIWQSGGLKLSADVTAHLKKVIGSGAAGVTVILPKPLAEPIRPLESPRYCFSSTQ